MISGRQTVVISPELLDKMRAACVRDGQATEFVVVWDGTDRRVNGKYLALDTEAQVQQQHMPRRRLRDLAPDDVAQILADVELFGFEQIAARHAVSVETVEHLAFAMATGHLVSR